MHVHSRLRRSAKSIAERVSRNFAGRKTRPDVFISATSADLRTMRKIVRDALLDCDCFPVEQSHFSPDYRKVEEMLRAKIERCHAMIHLVGMRYGAEPLEARPADAPRRSYTQMEYDIARELGDNKCRVFTLLCPEDFPYDETDEEEDGEKERLQQEHRRRFLSADTTYTRCHDQAEVRECVLRLQDVLNDLRSDIHTYGLRLVLTVVLHWVALLAILGALCWGIARVVAWTDTITSELREERALDRQASRESTDAIVEALQKDDTVESQLSQAARQFDSADYAAAFHTYARLSDEAPAHIEWHRRVEDCARRGSLQQRLLERYSLLVEQDPDNAIFRNYLGNACLMLDPLDADGIAREHYEMALRLDPELAPPMANLGILYARAGKRDQAEACFRDYIKLHPDDAPARVNLGLLHLARVMADAGDTNAIASSETALKAAIGIDRGSASAYKHLGRLYLVTGRKEEGLDAYRRSLKLDKDQEDVRELLSSEFGNDIPFSTQGDGYETRAPVQSDSTQLSPQQKDERNADAGPQ